MPIWYLSRLSGSDSLMVSAVLPVTFFYEHWCTCTGNCFWFAVPRLDIRMKKIAYIRQTPDSSSTVLLIYKFLFRSKMYPNNLSPQVVRKWFMHLSFILIWMPLNLIHRVELLHINQLRSHDRYMWSGVRYICISGMTTFSGLTIYIYIYINYMTRCSFTCKAFWEREVFSFIFIIAFFFLVGNRWAAWKMQSACQITII